MSFLLSRVGQFLAGSSDSLPIDPEESLESLETHERSYLDESLGTLQTAALLEDRRSAAHGLLAFAKLHRLVNIYF